MAYTDQGLMHWLQSRKSSWKVLSEQLDQHQDKKNSDLKSCMELVQGHRNLARDLSLARSFAQQSKMTRYLEQLFFRLHDVIYRQPSHFRHDLKKLYLVDIPTIIKNLILPIISITLIFILSGAAAGWLINEYPELISLVASEEMIEKVQQGSLWTDGLLNIMPSSVLSLSIMSNNIMVSLFAFCLGALYGLGTLYIIVMNGFMLGGVFAFTARYDLDGRLFEFIIAHGVVELSIICLAGAAGVQLGEAIMRPGDQTRRQAFAQATANMSKLLAVIIPFLIGAGLIEGYISPDPSYPLAAKITIGIGYGIILWSVLNASLWHFIGVKK